MVRLNVHEAKTHLSRYLDRLRLGETIILCKRNVPIAEIRPISKPRKPPRIGLAKDKLEIPESFYEPLPPDVLVSFYGDSKAPK